MYVVCALCLCQLKFMYQQNFDGSYIKCTTTTTPRTTMNWRTERNRARSKFVNDLWPITCVNNKNTHASRRQHPAHSFLSQSLSYIIMHIQYILTYCIFLLHSPYRSFYILCWLLVLAARCHHHEFRCAKKKQANKTNTDEKTREEWDIEVSCIIARNHYLTE